MKWNVSRRFIHLHIALPTRVDIQDDPGYIRMGSESFHV